MEAKAGPVRPTAAHCMLSLTAIGLIAEGAASQRQTLLSKHSEAAAKQLWLRQDPHSASLTASAEPSRSGSPILPTAFMQVHVQVWQ